MDVVLLISGILFMLSSLYFCVRPHIPAVIPAYGGLWLLQWSGMMAFPSVMMSYWGIMAVVVIIIVSMLPQPVVKATQGMAHITVGAVAGMLIGATIGYAPMIVGCMVFVRTPKGKALGLLTSRFVQYFCAKGLPVVVTVSILGIAIEVAAVQYSNV